MSAIGACAVQNQGLVEMQRIILEPKQELCKDTTKFGGGGLLETNHLKKNSPKSNTV